MAIRQNNDFLTEAYLVTAIRGNSLFVITRSPLKIDITNSISLDHQSEVITASYIIESSAADYGFRYVFTT